MIMIKKFLTVFVFVVLICINVNAECTDKYIVKLNNCDVPSELYEKLCPLNEEERLYTADQNIVDAYKQYFEYVHKDEVVEVKGIEMPENDIISLFGTTTLPSQYDYINAEFAWGLNTFGNEVNIAVIDTGCNAYDDFGDNLKGGYNYVDSKADFSDENGHGTHVCGIIGAALKKTVTGVSPKVNIYALKCIKDGGGTTTTMLVNAIYDAVNKYNCKVISMSIGFDDYSDIYSALKYAYNKGVILVAAVGNEGRTSGENTIKYPAGYDEVIGVGSCSINGTTGEFERTSFSQKNSSVMVMAPGTSVKSTYKNGSYAYLSGTSQATPMVAASAAILLSIDPDMTPDEFKTYIKTCSQPINDDYCGYGLLDIEAMFKECIKDRDWYISPMDEDGVAVYNNTDEKVIGTAILVGTDGGEYARIGTVDIELESKDKVQFNPTDMQFKKMFFWQKNLKPIFKPVISTQ